jgi:hypothetical protein
VLDVKGKDNDVQIHCVLDAQSDPAVDPIPGYGCEGRTPVITTLSTFS